jgi:gamma-glutamyltranspeptidase/glutathione hydrolase
MLCNDMFARTTAVCCAALTLGIAQALTVPAPAAATLTVESDAGMVVTSQHLASEVGAAILRQGGNAIDAAVAVGYALAVTHPCCGNLGGGGFMTIHLADGKDTFINFRERAPLAATTDMFLDGKRNPIVDKSLDGYLAVGVPGTVLGLETARQEYGTLSRAILLAPAIRLANEGFTLIQGDVDVLVDGNEAFRRQTNLSAVFLNDGKPLQPGDRLVQKNLAHTLRAISARG